MKHRIDRSGKAGVGPIPDNIGKNLIEPITLPLTRGSLCEFKLRGAIIGPNLGKSIHICIDV
jgi:hypothetical protein